MKKRILSALSASVMAVTGTSLLFPEVTFAADNNVCINEVCSQNKNSLTDSYGKNADWIELFNSGSTAVDISGYGLSDGMTFPPKWTFPAGTVIQPNDYLIVFASGRESVGNELHANFSISKNGETIVLSDATGSIIQKVEVPTLGEDMTYGRTPDGGDTLEIMDATPGKSNSAVVSAPVFSAGSGFYGTDFALSMTAADGTQIYYTTDGSDPKTSNTAQTFRGDITVKDRTNEKNIYSALAETDGADSICRGIGYKAPSFNVDKATVVRAAARDSEGRFSKTVSQTYFITSGNLAQYKNTTVVSLVTDPNGLFDPETGIYVTGNKYTAWKNSGSYDPAKSVWDTDNVCNYFSKGKEWERQADITIFENGEPVVQQNMGIRIKGASTRNHAQKSFNLYARSEYGASKIDYPIFPNNCDIDGNPVKKYDSLSLRSIVDETRINDSISQSLISDRDLGTQEMKPCVVFLNGEYWGMYQITERLSDYFIETNYGIPKQNVAMIKNGQSEEGPMTECDRFYEFVNKYAKMDLTNEANYRDVCDFIDIDTMIDHYAAGLYLNTYDWPNTNCGMWRNTGDAIEGNKYSDGKWRFMTFDMDYTMGTSYEELGTDGWAYDSFRHMDGQKKYAPTNLFVKLLENEDFRNKFVGVYCDYANDVLLPEKGSSKVDEFSRNYTDMLAQNLLRWWGFYGGDPAGTLAWNKQNFQTKVAPNLVNFLNKRESYTLDHMKNYLNLSGNMQMITLKSGGNGNIKINSIIPDLARSPWSGKYFSDCPVTLTALPFEGYTFAGWSGDVEGNSPTITVSLSKAMTIQANFVEAKDVKGDVNGDGQFNTADLVALSNYLLGNGKLADTNAADLCNDGKIDTFDLVAMRKELVK